MSNKDNLTDLTCIYEDLHVVTTASSSFSFL